jgi:hypothetical protein
MESLFLVTLLIVFGQLVELVEFPKLAKFEKIDRIRKENPDWETRLGQKARKINSRKIVK